MKRSLHDQRTLWAFWIACGLTAAGGLAPLLLGGGSHRIGVVYSYLVATVALAACALLYERGRPVVTTLFFIAGIAVVYGILSLIAMPVQLAVLGTCPPEPASCASGLEQPLTDNETASLGFAIGIGIVALVTGFFGLIVVYRRLAASALPSTAPVRRIAPVAIDAPPGQKTEAAPKTAAPEAAAELDELPAPAEARELPAPTEEEAAEPNITASVAKAGRRRTPQQTPPAPTPPNPDS